MNYNNTIKGILDENYSKNINCGSKTLLWEVVNRIKPKIHAFGHIHESYGYSYNKDTYFVNSAVISKEKIVEQKPIIITFNKTKNDIKITIGKK